MSTHSVSRFSPFAVVSAFAMFTVQPALVHTVGIPVGGSLAAQVVGESGGDPPAGADTLAVLSIDEYARWRSVGSTSLSPDASWATYAYSQREVDDSLFIVPLGDDTRERHVIVRGSGPTFSGDSRWVAYFVNPPGQEGGRGRGGRGGGGGGGGRGGQANADRPQRAAELLNLETGAKERWENVQSFAFADAGGVLLVKKLAADSDAEYDGTDLIVHSLDNGTEDLIAYVDEWALDQVGARVAYALDTPDGESNALLYMDLKTRARTVLDAEREASYARVTWGDDEDEPSADALAALKGREFDDLVETENALIAWPALSKSKSPILLDPRPEPEDSADEGEGEDTDGGGADAGNGGSGSGGDGAVDASSDDTPGSTDAEDAGDAAVRGARRANGDDHPALRYAMERDPVNGFPAGWVLSEGGQLRWAPDASRLFVEAKPQQATPETLCEAADEGRAGRRGRGGTGEAGEGGDTDSGSAAPVIARLSRRTDPDGRPLGPEEVQDGTCPEFMADVDIWHVDDERIQSVQIIQAGRDRQQTYTSVVHLRDGAPRFVQLADQSMESLRVSDDGHHAIGSDPKPYTSDWLPNYADYYDVDLETGERSMVLEKQLRTLGFDPDGEHFLYWKDGQIWTYETRNGEHRSITQNAPVSFVDEEFDRFGEKPPYGVAGWTTDGDPILEHRYDLYVQPIDGDAPTNLTRGMGTENEIRFSIIDLDPDEDEIDIDEPILLSAYGQWTKKEGFYRLDDGRMEELVTADASFGRPQKADSADVMIFTRGDFRTFPDYWVSGPDFDDPVRLTDANPQQSEYRWGHRILFEYETEDGVRLQGTLAIPDDYQPGERRPMLINFYEKLSQNLHQYPTPRYASAPNFAGYVSAGYLVMQPDIHFRTGPSHQQMLEGINLAIDAVIELGYVDPDRIALHGHSYSGQGAAYISTHSDRFAAITAGAAASNLVSDFNQLWKSAGSNQHGYDIYGQGRFATNPYDDFDLFVDQSATQNADQMNSPLLLLHGTDDGSVEWLQAVEFYNGLRWNGKNVILLSYPGEAHGLRNYENQKDFQIRMRQFFDHYLRDMPAPKWMEQGRPLLQKDRDIEMMNGNANGGGNGGG